MILACAMCASFARQAAAVATLSVFIVPMTTEFDWSRAEISGAVSLGGVLAALISPTVGTLIDRVGARDSPLGEVALRPTFRQLWASPALHALS